MAAPPIAASAAPSALPVNSLPATLATQSRPPPSPPCHRLSANLGPPLLVRSVRCPYFARLRLSAHFCPQPPHLPPLHPRPKRIVPASYDHVPLPSGSEYTSAVVLTHLLRCLGRE
eukprot:6202858-Pleurochrysis_carterae.AAC.2